MEEFTFKFQSTDEIARQKALNYIYLLQGVSSVTFSEQSNLLTVKGEGIDKAKIMRKIDKFFQPKKSFFSCFS
ncbi:unnamed protein product [Arabidopsis lyrata]|uniref:Predicted protein n=1 Tax=Arabidopsis lyrata subsp. lyrata TaxID=81972 RepID=D7M326_ARALL|nr:predicted protein [Arabidopsis lyrata subsp. lyrata]CAH8272087.1 unnamed protein product [Arabidopsis lyrata]